MAQTELAEKQAAQQRFFDAVARTYPNDPEAQSPPTAFTPPRLITSMTAMEVGTIILYNHATGCPPSVLTGPAGTPLTFTNPWTYNHQTRKWSYAPNDIDYLYRVVYDEYQSETALPTSE